MKSKIDKIIENIEKEREKGEKGNQESINKLNETSLEEKYKLEIDAMKDILNMRKEWNCFIKLFVGLLIISQTTIIILIGSHVLNYNSNTVISIFFSETFLQIVGLALIVVKYLFPQIY